MSPKIIVGLVLTAFVFSLLPLALIARSRASKSTRTAPHMVLDMDKQPRFDPQTANPMFADQRAMRPHIAGTVAREDMELKNESLIVPGGEHRMVGGEAKSEPIASPETYAALTLGRVRAAGMTDAQFNAVQPPKDPNAADQRFYITAFPPGIEVNADLLARGQERFTIYCAPCHGATGYGDGMIHRRAVALQSTRAEMVSMWTAPSNLTDADRRARPTGHIFNTITNGIRNMPAYDKQISVPDRWAIVAYVKALQDSQGAAPAK